MAGAARRRPDEFRDILGRARDGWRDPSGQEQWNVLTDVLDDQGMIRI